MSAARKQPRRGDAAAAASLATRLEEAAQEEFDPSVRLGEVEEEDKLAAAQYLCVWVCGSASVFACLRASFA